MSKTMNFLEQVAAMKGKHGDGGPPAQTAVPRFVEKIMQYIHLDKSYKDVSSAMNDPVLARCRCIAMLQAPSKIALPDNRQAVVMMLPGEAVDRVRNNLIEVLEALLNMDEGDVSPYVPDIQAFREALQQRLEEVKREVPEPGN